MTDIRRAKTSAASNSTSFAPATHSRPDVTLQKPETQQTDSPIRHMSLQAYGRSAREMARLLHDQQITVDAPYQRPSVWTQEQRMNLVRSWLSGLPIPAIILAQRDRGADGSGPDYAAVDGKQRLEAATDWFFGDLAVPASWFQRDHIENTVNTDDGPYVAYSGLTLIGQRLMSNRAQLPTLEVGVVGLEEEAAMFDLVNTSGTAQTDEDLQRARDIAAPHT